MRKIKYEKERHIKIRKIIAKISSIDRGFILLSKNEINKLNLRFYFKYDS